MTGRAPIELHSSLFDFDVESRIWVLSTGGNLRRLDLSSGELAKRHTLIDVEGVDAVALGPAGESLLLIDRAGCSLFEEPLASGPLRPLPFEGVVDACFSRDGRQLVLVHGSEGVLTVDVEGLELAWAWSYDRSVMAPRLYASQDGNRYAIRMSEHIVVLDAAQGGVISEIGLPQREILDAAPDAQLASWALALNGGRQLYRARRVDDERFLYEAIEALPPKSLPMRHLTRDARGHVFWSNEKGEIWWLGDDDEPRCVLISDGPVQGLTTSPDGRHLVVQRGPLLEIYPVL